MTLEGVIIAAVAVAAAAILWFVYIKPYRDGTVERDPDADD